MLSVLNRFLKTTKMQNNLFSSAHLWRGCWSSFNLRRQPIFSAVHEHYHPIKHRTIIHHDEIKCHPLGNSSDLLLQMDGGRAKENMTIIMVMMVQHNECVPVIEDVRKVIPNNNQQK